MKAIETKYKGYRFRSRLEARWAVYFDAIGLEWEYEKEGFELENGERYLPDFWLPKLECWVEIRPKNPVDKNDCYKDKRLTNFSREQLLLVFFGLPGEYRGWCFCQDSCDSGGGEGIWSIKWVYSDKHKDYRVTADDKRSDRTYCYGDWKGTETIIQFFDYNEGGYERMMLYSAYEKARSARFEFGENGAMSDRDLEYEKWLYKSGLDEEDEHVDLFKTDENVGNIESDKTDKEADETKTN